jgi:HK97 family phage major capsid protein
MDLKTAYEDRAEIAKEVRRLADLANADDHNWTAEDQAQWELANKDYDELSQKIQLEERAAQIERQQTEKREAIRPNDDTKSNGGGVAISDHELELEQRRDDRSRPRYGERPTVEEECLALQGWCRYQAGMELREEHRAACRRVGVNPAVKEYEISLRRTSYRNLRREIRAQSTSATEGGETIPEGFVANFEKALLSFGGIRQVADVMRTTSGNDMPWPTTNDTTNKGVIVGENIAVAEQDIITGAVIFKAFKYTSKLVRVSVELLQDSAFDLASELGTMLGERIGRIQNDHFTTGDGTAEPQGMITAATEGKETASSTAITSDEVLDLLHSVDPAYRDGATWTMHDSVVLVIRKLKGNDNNYLWQPGYQLGIPDRLLGYPLVVNQSMDSALTAGKKVIAFGQLSKHKVRDVAGLRLRRLVERYAELDQEGFVAFARADSRLLDAGTAPIKFMTMKP